MAPRLTTKVSSTAAEFTELSERGEQNDGLEEFFDMYRASSDPRTSSAHGHREQTTSAMHQLNADASDKDHAHSNEDEATARLASEATFLPADLFELESELFFPLPFFDLPWEEEGKDAFFASASKTADPEPLPNNGASSYRSSPAKFVRPSSEVCDPALRSCSRFSSRVGHLTCDQFPLVKDSKSKSESQGPASWPQAADSTPGQKVSQFEYSTSIRGVPLPCPGQFLTIDFQNGLEPTRHVAESRPNKRKASPGLQNDQKRRALNGMICIRCKKQRDKVCR